MHQIVHSDRETLTLGIVQVGSGRTVLPLLVGLPLRRWDAALWHCSRRVTGFGVSSHHP